jgi:hypothetical protein
MVVGCANDAASTGCQPIGKRVDEAIGILKKVTGSVDLSIGSLTTLANFSLV